jgi:cytochrome c553
MERADMKYIFTLMALFGALCTASAASATPATHALFAKYKAAGAGSFSADRGQKLWTRESKSESGEMMSCTTCHTSDLTKEGKHHKTGKLIKPMAPSANAERFTDAKKIEKWFKRNCNDVWSRECTAQEKGDILTFLLSK